MIFAELEEGGVSASRDNYRKQCYEALIEGIEGRTLAHAVSKDLTGIHKCSGALRRAVAKTVSVDI